MNKTERLYYNDPYLLEFEATVVESMRVATGHGLVLDRTAFYPTSGGQPNDLGTMNGIPLIDCYEDEATGAVIHVTAEAVEAARVHGKIDDARRRDHMQQHSGQHVLSQAFVELFNYPTVSFHLGTLMSTIDLPVESLTRQQAERAEDLANRIVQENRAVSICYVPTERISEIGLRKPTERAGDVRVIDISGFDKSACGGTHVRMTGEIGPILITRIERAKKQTRIEFLCGGRVVRYAREANRTLDAISQIVSAPQMDSAAAVRTLWNDLQDSRKRGDDLESKLLDYEAAEFPVRDGIALAAFKGRGIEKIKLLAQKICSRPGTIALLADESDQIRIVFARSVDGSVDVSAVLRKTLERFGGKGGGRPSLAQGGGLSAPDGVTVLNHAKGLLAS